MYKDGKVEALGVYNMQGKLQRTLHDHLTAFDWGRVSVCFVPQSGYIVVAEANNGWLDIFTPRGEEDYCFRYWSKQIDTMVYMDIK